MNINSVMIEAKGPLGSGKTQILELVKKALEKEGLEAQEIREHTLLINGELKNEKY